MKKLIGIFDIKKYTPEQIYEKAKKILQENERIELLEMARARGKLKKVEKK